MNFELGGLHVNIVHRGIWNRRKPRKFVVELTGGGTLAFHYYLLVFQVQSLYLRIVQRLSCLVL